MGTRRLTDSADFLAAIIGDSIDHKVEGLGTVKIRGLTVREREQLRDYIETNEKFTIQVVIRGMTEPKLSPKDADRLWDADNRKLTSIARKILALSAEEDEDDLEKKVGSGSSEE